MFKGPKGEKKTKKGYVHDTLRCPLARTTHHEHPFTLLSVAGSTVLITETL